MEGVREETTWEFAQLGSEPSVTRRLSEVKRSVVGV